MTWFDEGRAWTEPKVEISDLFKFMADKATAAREVEAAQNRMVANQRAIFKQYGSAW